MAMPIRGVRGGPRPIRGGLDCSSASTVRPAAPLWLLVVCEFPSRDARQPAPSPRLGSAETAAFPRGTDRVRLAAPAVCRAAMSPSTSAADCRFGWMICMRRFNNAAFRVQRFAPLNLNP